MYLVLVMQFLVSGEPVMPQVLMVQDTIHQCEALLKVFADQDVDVNIEATTQGTITAVRHGTYGETWAVCALNKG